MPIEYDLSNDEYHNERPGYSSTFIKTTHLKSIYHAKNGTSSIALSIADMGTAVHAIVLEPEKEIVRCGPETRRGNAWKDAYAEAEADGVTLLPEKEYHQVFDIAHALLAHPEAKDILTADDKVCVNLVSGALRQAIASHIRTQPDLAGKALDLADKVASRGREALSTR